MIGDGIKIDKRGRHYFLDGVEVPARAYRKRYPLGKQAPTLVRSRRQKSIALAVHPSQVEEASSDAVRKGVPTEFTRDGRPIFESRAHRKKYFQAYGYFDRDAGYGDAAPQHHKGDRAPPNPLRERAMALAHRIRLRHSSSED
jgi:hypothetical protein